MKLVKMLAALSLISCVAACAPSGYYDANGQYHAYGQNDTYRNNNTMSNTASADSANGYTVGGSAGSPPYGQSSNYDHYVAQTDTGLAVPQGYLPPRGMCRVWFLDRPLDEQAAVESCDGIKTRVPVGAYVIYGG